MREEKNIAIKSNSSEVHSLSALAAPFCFWTAVMMGLIRKKHICGMHKWTKEHTMSHLGYMRLYGPKG